eukprot:UN04776
MCSTPLRTSRQSVDRARDVHVGHNLDSNSKSLKTKLIRRYPVRTLMRLEYSPPPYNNGDSGTNNNSTVQNTWKERGVPPDIHVVRQQASYLQAINQS